MVLQISPQNAPATTQEGVLHFLHHPPLKLPHDRNNSCFLQSHRFRPFCSANRGDQTRPNHAPRKLRRKPTWRSSSRVGFATFAQVDGRPNGRVLFLSLFFSLSLSLSFAHDFFCLLLFLLCKRIYVLLLCAESNPGPERFLDGFYPPPYTLLGYLIHGKTCCAYSAVARNQSTSFNSLPGRMLKRLFFELHCKHGGPHNKHTYTPTTSQTVVHRSNTVE